LTGTSSAQAAVIAGLLAFSGLFMALNDTAWQAIFDELRIVEKVDAGGFCDITALQIKKITGREPRLMAKIDFREQLPSCMEKQGLGLLAISNGSYRTGRFDPFVAIEPEIRAAPEKMSFPRGFLTLDPQALNSESAALDAALLGGILARIFGEDVALTIRGRTRNMPFEFSLSGITFPVDGVQIEVDGGYEGAGSVNLVEAKIGARSNINLRQLLYPQMAWEKALAGRKKVRSFICFYQEPVLRFIPVLYDGALCRADHANERAFLLEPEARLNLMAIPERPAAPLPLLGVPFPQADSFETVLAMLAITAREECVEKEKLLGDFDVDPRQIDYYSSVMRWLGLVEQNDGVLRMTAEGRRIAALAHAERMQALADIIFGEPIFHHALHHGVDSVPDSLFERWKCSGSTIGRRKQTVAAWIKYFRSFAEKRR
jgi:hypothetical protein